MNVRRTLPALVLLAALVTGCSTVQHQDSTDGPLDQPGDSDGGSGVECIPARTGGSIFFGGDELHNYGHKALVIDKITLRKASGVRLVEALIVSNSSSFIGYGHGWPPDPEARTGPGIDWAHRRKAVGATISPQSDHAKVANNLVLRLQVTAASGARMAGIQVRYHVDGSAYRWDNALGLTVETKKTSC